MFKATVIRKPHVKAKPVTIQQEDIVAAFRNFARDQGFRMQKRSDFATDLDYRLYQSSFQACYHRFVQARKEGRVSQYIEPPLHRIPENYETPKSTICVAWENLRKGAHYVWKEIREEKPGGSLPKPSAIRDHVISTFPGLALVHYYWKNRKESNPAARYTCLMASLYLSMFLTVSFVSISIVSGSFVKGHRPSVSFSACIQV